MGCRAARFRLDSLSCGVKGLRFRAVGLAVYALELWGFRIYVWQAIVLTSSLQGLCRIWDGVML